MTSTRSAAGQADKPSPALILVGAAFVIAVFALWAIVMIGAPPQQRQGLALVPASFSDLDGWARDSLADAVPAWRRSCQRFLQKPDDELLNPANDLLGTAADWRPVCKALDDIKPHDHVAARAFFEEWFTPVAALAGRDPEGLFTGYYEPELNGSLVRTSVYDTPIRGLPDDLVQVDLGVFRDEMRGERIAGRVVQGRLQPYADREQIEKNGLGPAETVLAWVDSPVDAFFLHIQGSGRIRLPDDNVIRVGFAGQNGHPYTAIGRVLIEMGEMSREAVTMPAIRSWLAANPEQADDVMMQNASYIFFRRLRFDDPSLGPLGAEGVPLTPGRSLAVDARYYAYGMPVWLEVMAPRPGSEEDRPFRRLMVAQDTGGAIRGPVRGDVFWGFGERAGDVAGRMKHRGRIYLLLPRALAERNGLMRETRPASPAS